ncbi:MAG: winged helix-turn-helix transcriptional regulator [Cyanobacteria bacterium J06633_2]
MLIKYRVLELIAEGSVTLAFRRWKRPTVKTGGQLKTAVGVLEINAVTVIDVDEITEEDAQRAGYSSRSALLQVLDKNGEGEVYRIDLRFAGPDPREVLREQVNLSDDELAEVQKRLEQLDQKSRSGSWTMMILRLIQQYPGMRAKELSALANLDPQVLKVRVRKLKEFGLTESLTRGGYQLSPRGCEVLKHIGSSM